MPPKPKYTDEKYIGEIYGDFKVIQPYYVPPGRHTTGGYMWACQCVRCGDVVGKRPGMLIGGMGRTCKCSRGKVHTDSEIGKRYGRLTIVGVETRELKHGSKPYAVCECECGNMYTASLHNIIYGRTKSCGCLRRRP